MVHQQIEKKCIAKVYEHTRHKPKKRILVEIMLVDLLKTQVEEEYKINKNKNCLKSNIQ